MNKQPNDKCPECDSTLCDLCKERRADAVMSNNFNGNKLKVCWGCHKDVWGGVIPNE